MKSGPTGECIPTGECSKSGGQSEAGHCPGDKDIQCCTHSTNQPSDSIPKLSDDEEDLSDNDDDEKSGDDDDKDSDDDDDEEDSNDDDDDDEKDSNDDDDQKLSDEGTCKIGNGTIGTCMCTTECAGKGGKSEAGHCPGAADIQVSYSFDLLSFSPDKSIVLHVRVLQC